MNRDEIIQKILSMAAGSPLESMFQAMPWWNKWDELSDPGLQKVLETLEWHRSRMEEMVDDAIKTSPEAHTAAYGAVRHADMTKLQRDEAKSDDSSWSSDQLLAQI